MKSSDEPVMERMQSLIQQWEKNANPQATFLGCYRMMTGNMFAAIEQHEFRDPVWVRRLLHSFAEYYFKALGQYEQFPSAAPPVWQVAHDSCRDAGVWPVQNMLLGVNAHINYDLVLTLVDLLKPEWITLSPAQQEERYLDYCHVNEVIARTIDAVQDRILEPAMPVMELVDRVMGPLDELLMTRLLTSWRETVWQNACSLLESSAEAETASLMQEIEDQALEWGNRICPRSGRDRQVPLSQRGI